MQLVAGGSRWQGILVTDKRSAIMSSLAPGAQATRSMQLSTARLVSAVKISLGSVVPVVTTSIKPSKVRPWRCAKVLVGARGFVLATEDTLDEHLWPPMHVTEARSRCEWATLCDS